MTNYLSISIKTDSQSLVEQALSHPSVAPLILEAKDKFDVHVLIDDNRENYAFMDKFLIDEGLEDENEFFRTFDITPFGFAVDFEAPRVHEYPELHLLVFEIAQQLSNVLGVQTIFMKDNSENPVALFDNGAVVQ